MAARVRGTVEGVLVGVGRSLETIEGLRARVHRAERQHQQAVKRLALEQRANDLWRQRYHALLASSRRPAAENDFA
jgi:hypothetical protein